MRDKAILFVTDEKHTIKALNRVFLNTPNQLFFAAGGAAALALLQEQAIDLVISDINLPDTDGHTLLKKIKEKYPLSMRVILSNFAGDRKIITALQDGSAKLYLLKPWDNESLLDVVNQLLELGEMFRSKDLFRLVQDADKLPTLPSIYTKVSALIENDESIERIAAAIEQDQAIAGRVLSVVNSVYYATKTGSIKQAIVFLGLANVKNIVLSTSILDGARISNNSYFDKELLWRHVHLTSRFVSEIYNELLKKPLPERSATAGLLHDIGRLVLLQSYPDEYARIIEAVKSYQSASFEEAEMNILGTTHQEIGGFLLNWWGLPHAIVEATMFHHNPFDHRVLERELAAVVHLADCYSWKRLGIGSVSRLNSAVFNYLGISKEDCDELTAKMLVR